MCGTAAHLVDQVLPRDVPVRQWVLTAPYEVRRVLALRPDALTACGRVFVEEIARWQKRAGNGGETGAITFVQRFDGTLGSFVHFHVAVPDGVFRRAEGGAVTFHEGPAPSRAGIAAVAERVERRVTRWLRRRGLIDERAAEERSNEAPELSPLEACMQLSLFGSTFLRLATDGTPVPLEDERARAAARGPWIGEASGFNVHAGVTVRAGDSEGLERLLRYCARPPFSLERMSRLPDGRVAYLLRKPRRNGATHLVMTPVQFLARISALIPPPRYPLVRFSGVFAPRSPWRAGIVPRTAAARMATSPSTKKKKREAASSLASGRDRASSEPGRASEYQASRGPRTSLGDGFVRPVGARLDWASLLRRVYLEDVLACPCGGRRSILVDITAPDVVVAILAHLALPTAAPPVARARSPGEDPA
jgi:hypothetical protein